MNIHTSHTPPAKVDADLLAIGVTADGLADALAPLGDKFAQRVIDAATSDEFKGAADSALMLPTYGQIACSRLILVGLGAGSIDEVRRAAGQVGSAARKRGASRVAANLGTLDAAGAKAAVEGFLAGNYRYDRYKPEDQRKAGSSELTLLGDVDGSDFTAAEAIAAGQRLARDLVNGPAAEIYPETLARSAAELAGDAPGLTVEVWDETRIRAEGMVGIMGVGQGSDRPPRFVHMHYTPQGTPRAKLCLVGKGVTFDSGGLSLKPSAAMQTMRCDMGGAAAVIGAMKAIAAIGPDVEVHAVFGAVENMVNGNSYKLGDVLTYSNGKTVEIHNTDAEGRLVLADCLVFASKLDVDVIVDLATLTGACVVALGPHYTGLFTPDDGLATDLLGAADVAGESLWRMPMPEHYKEQLKADWGAIKNVGGREGGAITAALFLSEFVAEGKRWAHFDIAGPAFLDKPYRQYATGGTGAMVATLVQWVTSR